MHCFISQIVYSVDLSKIESRNHFLPEVLLKTSSSPEVSSEDWRLSTSVMEAWLRQSSLRPGLNEGDLASSSREEGLTKDKSIAGKEGLREHACWFIRDDTPKRAGLKNDRLVVKWGGKVSLWSKALACDRKKGNPGKPVEWPKRWEAGVKDELEELAEEVMTEVGGMRARRSAENDLETNSVSCSIN